MSGEATVFVIDDDPEALRSMRWLLESEDLAVETYASGEEFLGAYDARHRGASCWTCACPRWTASSCSGG